MASSQRISTVTPPPTPGFVRHQPVAGDVPFEFSTVRRLRARIGVSGTQRRSRSAFDLVIAPTRGSGSHEVDYQSVHLDRNHWLYIRSGQLHRWGPATYDADLIVLEPVDEIATWRSGPHRLVFTDPQLDDVAPLLDLLKVERVRPDLTVMHVARDLFVEWMQLGASEERPGNVLYTQFRNLLEVSVVDVRTVGHCAIRLGVTERQLITACSAAGASHPQKMIDAALLLEAKRLFGHPHATVEGVAERLGFDAPSLRKFFRRGQGKKLDRWLLGTVT